MKSYYIIISSLCSCLILLELLLFLYQKYEENWRYLFYSLPYVKYTLPDMYHKWKHCKIVQCFILGNKAMNLSITLVGI